MITEKQLIDDLLRLQKEYQKIPSQNFYRKYGKYHITTYGRHFGSWNQSLLKCFGKINRIKYPLLPINKCQNCNKETKNPKYCSRSCAAEYNNKLHPKRKNKEKFCDVCKNKLKNARHNYCKKCSVLEKIKSFGEKTISNFNSTYLRHKHQMIRNHAHRIMKYYNINKKCKICNYDKHVDLAHIKSISSFDKNTKLNTVNDIQNLIYLCKNHHWELDHKILII